MLKELKTSIIIFAVLTVITGVVYPLFITAAAQALFRRQANGSLIYRNGQAIGSRLIGQQFDDPKYFWERLSATSPSAFNASSSSGSNLGPSNPALVDEAAARVKALKAADPGNQAFIPVDLVTSSASGLDPQISPAAALYQVARVSRLRGLPQDRVRQLVSRHTSARFLGLIGEPAVNVLELNCALDGQK